MCDQNLRFFDDPDIETTKQRCTDKSGIKKIRPMMYLHMESKEKLAEHRDNRSKPKTQNRQETEKLHLRLNDSVPPQRESFFVLSLCLCSDEQRELLVRFAKRETKKERERKRLWCRERKSRLWHPWLRLARLEAREREGARVTECFIQPQLLQ